MRAGVKADARVARLVTSGMGHLQGARLGPADRDFRAVAAMVPDHPGAALALGVIAWGQGRMAVALFHARRAMALSPDAAGAGALMARVLRDLGRQAEAVAAFEAALRLEPGDDQVRLELGALLVGCGALAAAVAAYRDGVARAPGSAVMQFNLGLALFRQEAFEEAAAALRCAVELEPKHAAAWSSLGAALYELRRHGEAETCLRRALALDPGLAEASNNLGCVRRELGHDGEAEACFRAALAMRPGHGGTTYNLATTLLLTGRLPEGWAAYEQRWGTPTMPPRGFAQPLWRGEALAGRVLLLHAEQGLGDTLQFCRFVRAVAARGRVLLEVHGPLARLLARALPGVERVVARGEPLPAFDVQCPLMSLPGVLGTTLETIPGGVYLQADRSEAARWRKRLAALPGLRVGLVWRGSQQFADMRGKRDLPAALLAGLDVQGVSFVSLQKDAGEDRGGLPMVDWTGELDDFEATAGLVDGLDLVIGVDTAVVHLAGAMGQPVWLLNRFDTCWRWLRDREDSPWYPSMQQFRQESMGDWGGVVEQARQALERTARR